MKNPRRLFLCLCLFTLSFSYKTRAQQPAATANINPDRIIRAFTAKEARFRAALNQYAFKRDVVIQTIGMGGQINREYRRISTFTFDDKGNRYERVSFHPMPTFTGVTPEDLEDLGGVDPFALETSKIDKYRFTYGGKEHIDELDLYVFDVEPKVIPDPKKTSERLFKGRIWVDDRDLQIVKSRGKGVPDTKNNKFPTVDTTREQIDGNFWFPTYIYADEQLVFGNGSVMHVRMRVRYSDYERAVGKVTIRNAEDPEPKPSPSKPKPKQ
jgi:hypothetical protein